MFRDIESYIEENKQLRAENERLKEALNKIIESDRGCGDTDDYGNRTKEDSCDAMVKIAKQALKG